MNTLLEQTTTSLMPIIPKIHTISFVCPECFDRVEIPLGGTKQTPKCMSCYQDGVISIMEKEEN